MNYISRDVSLKIYNIAYRSSFDDFIWSIFTRESVHYPFSLGALSEHDDESGTR